MLHLKVSDVRVTKFTQLSAKAHTISQKCYLLHTYKHSSPIQVTACSLSDSAGLAAGDLLVAVNGEDVQNLRHKVTLWF